MNLYFHKFKVKDDINNLKPIGKTLSAIHGNDN